MKYDKNIPNQLERVCALGREAVGAVSRILLRIDLLERNGRDEIDYLVKIRELMHSDGDMYLLHPDECMCAAFVTLTSSNSVDVWLHELFLSSEIAEVERVLRGRLARPAP